MDKFIFIFVSLIGMLYLLFLLLFNNFVGVDSYLYSYSLDKDYVNAVLIIASKLNVSSIHILKDPHILYCTSQIILSTHSILLSENNQSIHLSILSPQSIQIELPLQELPTHLDFLPYHSNLGISLPPVEIHLQERILYTDSLFVLLLS